MQITANVSFWFLGSWRNTSLCLARLISLFLICITCSSENFCFSSSKLGTDMDLPWVDGFTRDWWSCQANVLTVSILLQNTTFRMGRPAGLTAIVSLRVVLWIFYKEFGNIWKITIRVLNIWLMTYCFNWRDLPVHRAILPAKKAGLTEYIQRILAITAAGFCYFTFINI